MMKRIFEELLIVGDPFQAISGRISNLLLLLLKFAPVAIFLDTINWWFGENSQFWSFVWAAILVNAIAGILSHLKMGTFNFPDFFLKNGIMIFSIIAMYIMLDMLRYTAGESFFSETFRILIQVTTLLYPTSKVAKNIHILTDGKYPPEFIMQKIFDFDKNGDLAKFFKKKPKDDEID